MAATQDEILSDTSVQLVLTSQIANERGPLAVRAMKQGQGFSFGQAGLDHAGAGGPLCARP